RGVRRPHVAARRQGHCHCCPIRLKCISEQMSSGSGLLMLGRTRRHMAGKIYDSPSAALKGLLFDGMTIMSGGFGLSGNPESLIPEIRDAGVKDLTVISNNAGADGFGLWMLLQTRQIRKMIASYVGENKLFEQQYLAGELEL